MKDLTLYKKSFNTYCFNIINDPSNEYYYSTNINSWKKQRLSELRENNNLTFKESLLKPYLIGLRDLMLRIVKLYSYINQNSASFKINHLEQEVLNLLEHIGSFSTSIKLNSAEGNYDIAYKLKEYCVLIFDDCINTTKNNLCIDIYKSPLKNNFLNAKIKLEQSANLVEVGLLSGKTVNTTESNTKLKNTPKKNIKDFVINIKDKNDFLDDLKKIFKTEKGIKFKILIELLKDEKVLMIGNREFKQFYKSIRDYFNRDIGTYSAFNDLYKHTDELKAFRSDEIAEISNKLNPLIIKYKSN